MSKLFPVGAYALIVESHLAAGMWSANRAELQLDSAVRWMKLFPCGITVGREASRSCLKWKGPKMNEYEALAVIFIAAVAALSFIAYVVGKMK